MSTEDSNNSDHYKASSADSDDEPIAAATADNINIEPLNMAEEEEDEEISLDGFGSASITSTSIDEQEDEEDDNAYFRDQIADANKEYIPRKSNQQHDLEIELTPKLKQAGIVEKFTFYRRTNAILLSLNHAYDRKNIIFTIDTKNWSKATNKLEKKLKQKGISKEHILLLLDVLDDNYERILELSLLSSSPPPQQYNGNSNKGGSISSTIATEEEDNSTVTAAATNVTRADVVIDPSKDLDPYIPDRDYVEFVIKTAKKTVKQEDSLVRQIVYTGLTKDSANPQNLAILAPTSEGKTHAALETLEYFPHADLWKLGSMSPKVIIRQNGILIDNNYEPIEEWLKELKKQIRACREDGKDDQADELEEQKHQLLQEAKVMIDLRGKLLVFLEPPHPETWNILKPILSHDSHYIEHPYVYHVEDFGFTVKKIVTRGWPACIFCSARNESKWPQWPEIQSRFLITSPNMIPQKYREGIKLSAQRKGLPRLAQQSMIVSDTDIELAKKCVLYLVSSMKRFLNDEFNQCPVWQPYASILGSALPGEKGTDNRIANRIFDFINIVALSHSHLRYMLKYGNETLVIANIEKDLDEVIRITQNVTGMPTFKVDFFKKYVLPPYKSKTKPDEHLTNSELKESIIGITTREVADYYKKKTGKSITTNAVKETYFDDYINNGWMDCTDSVINKKQYIYYPIIDFEDDDEEDISSSSFSLGLDKQQLQTIKSLSVMDSMDNVLQHPKILLPKNFKEIPENWLELEISALIKCPSVLTRFELYNEKNERLCICKFTKNYSNPASINGYFSRPVFRNYHNEIFGTMKYLGTSWLKTCKNISIDGITDKDVMVDDIQDLEKWWQNEQNKIKPLDASYFASTGVMCYYCDDFETGSLSKDGKRNYESHVKSKHGDNPDHPCYPTKEDIERLGLKAQGKDWEI